MDNVDYIIMCRHWQKNGFPYLGLPMADGAFSE